MKSLLSTCRSSLLSFSAVLYVLPFIAGCEGEKRAATPATTTNETKSVEVAKKSEKKKPEPKSTTEAPTPEKTNETNTPGPVPPVNQTPEQPSNVAPAPQPMPANAPLVDINKLEEVRKQLGFHSAVVLKSQVNVVANEFAGARANAITNTQRNIDIKLLTKEMSTYNALHNGKPPKDVPEFLQFLSDFNIGLDELPPNAFYIYDPKKAAEEKYKTNLEYLEVYEPE